VACLCSVRGSHRIGQTKPVTAWRIFPHARDARIAELIDSKAGLAAKALHASGEEVFSSADVQLEALVARCAAGVTYTMRRPGLLTCRNTGVSECPRGDTLHTHTVAAVIGTGVDGLAALGRETRAEGRQVPQQPGLVDGLRGADC
jgi:hypothetical protein